MDHFLSLNGEIEAKLILSRLQLCQFLLILRRNLIESKEKNVRNKNVNHKIYATLSWEKNFGTNPF